MVDPVTKRITGLLQGMSNMYAQWARSGATEGKDFLVRQIRIILDAIIEEIREDDRALFESQTAQLMILNFSKLLEWTVSGDMSQLPPELLPIACEIEGIEYAPQTSSEETSLVSVALPAGNQTPDAK